MQGIQYYDVKFPYVQSSGKHSTYWYVLVHTVMNWCRNTLHLNHNLMLTSLMVSFGQIECSAKYTCIFQIRVDALSGADLVLTWNLSFKFWHHID